MQSRLTTRPTQEVVAAIQALDLEPVKLRVMDAELGEGWSREYADSIGVAYRTYLTMLVKHPDEAESIMLSKDVDEFWHTHILQTIKYTEDCEQVFGAYLHHSPHVGERSAADMERRLELTEKTRELYQREFGGRKDAQLAWAGDAIKAGNAAYSNASIQERGVAYSNAAIKSGNAAYSNAAIRTGNAAYSNAAIKAGNAAYSNASIREQQAAYSNAAIRAGNAAYSNASIREQNAAYSNAAIKVDNAAYSNAAIRSDNAAYSNASIREKTPL